MKETLSIVKRKVIVFYQSLKDSLLQGLPLICPRSFILYIKQVHKMTVRVNGIEEDIYLRIESSQDISRAKGCVKEPGTVQWIRDYIKPDSVLYDIGANVGVFSLLASKQCQQAIKIYAFEPSFSTFPHLVFNILENGFEKNITPIAHPLSDKTGLFNFNYISLEPGTSLHSVDNKDFRGDVFSPVFQTQAFSFTLDDFIYEYGAQCPTHIKLDVDGAEHKILKGAQKLLADPTLRGIIVEICQENEDSMKIKEYLESYGFKNKHRFNHIYGEANKTYTNDRFIDYVFERA